MQGKPRNQRNKKSQGLKTHKEERNESVGGTLAIGGTTEVGRETDTRCGIIRLFKQVEEKMIKSDKERP